MADDSDLTIKVRMDSGDVVSKVDELASSLKGLTSATDETKTSTQEHGKAHGETSEKVGEASRATEELGSKLGALSGSTALASEVLEKFGIETGNASANLSFLGEAIEKLGNMAPMLLAVGSAVASLAAGFLLLKEGIDEAAASQEKLVSISALLRNQADDWKENTNAVNEYSEALAKGGTFARGEVLTGMQSMIAYGVSYNDMMRSQVAAQDLAKARGISLAESEQQLSLAYESRLRAMERLGLVTKQEVSDGLPYEELLVRIEQRMGGAASDALTTYIGKQQNLANNFNALVGGIGGALLPAMSDWVDMLRLVVQEMAPVTDEFVKWINTHLPELRDGIASFGRALGDLVGSALPPFLSAMENVLLGMASIGDWVSSHEETITYFFDVVLAGGALKTLSAFESMVPSVIAGLVAVEGELSAVAISEAFATMGMNLLVAGAVLGLADLIQHWDDTKEVIDEVLTALQNAVGSVASAIEGFFNGIAQAFNGFLDSMRQSIPVIGQVAAAVQSYYQQREESEQKLDSYEKSKSVVGGGPAAGIMGGGSAPLGGSALTAGASSTFSGGWGYNPLAGGYSGASAGSFGAYEGPPETHRSQHWMQGTARASGSKGAGSGGPTETYTDLDPYTEKTNKYAEAQKALEYQLKMLDASLDIDREKVASAATVDAESAAKTQLLADTKTELEAKSKLLTSAIHDEQYATFTLTEAKQSAIDRYEALRNATNSYGNGLLTQSTPATIEQKNALAALEDQSKKAKDAIAAASEALKTNSDNLTRNNEALVANAHALSTMKDEAAAAALAIDKANIAAQASWEEFTKKSATQMQEDLATFTMTNAQKFVYYQKLLADMGATTVDNEKEKERIYGQEVNAYKGSLEEIQKAYEKQVEAQKKLQDEELKTVDDFLSNIVLKHESLGDELKTIYQKIEQSFLSMVSGMITGSSGFQNALSHLGISGSTASQPGAGLFSGLLSAFSGNPAGQSASASGGPTGSSSSPFYVINADSTSVQLGKITGSPVGVDPSSLTALLNSGASAGGSTAQNSTGWYYSSSGSGLSSAAQSSNLPGESWFSGNQATGVPSSSNNLASQISSGISEALQGAAIGGLVASLTGGNSTYSSVGGAVGGAVGGPIGAVVGSLFGGLFGSHEQPYQQPDVSEPSYGTDTTYGQFAANWQGAPVTAGANTYNPASKYYTGLGGTSEEQGLLAAIQNTLAPNSGAAPTLVAEAQALLALTKGDKDSNALNIVNEKQGVFTLQSGAQISVQQFMQEVYQFLTNAGGSSAAVPTFTMSRAYQNANASQLGNAGTTPQGGVVLGTGAVSVTVHGNVIGTSGMAELSNTIAALLYKQSNGTAPSTGRAPVYSGPGGGY